MSAALQTADVEFRFRVTRSGDTTHLHGNITDATSFAALDDLLVDYGICDFGGVTFGSWIGLVGFCSYLHARNLHVRAVNIPAETFECLKIVQGATESIEFVSFVSPLVSGGKIVSEDVEDVEELNKAYADCEIGSMNGKQILNPQRFCSQVAFFSADPINFKEGWMKDSPDEATFWLSYIFFTQAIYDISVVLLHATEVDLLELLAGIRTNVEGGEGALKLINPNTNYTLVKRLDDSLKLVSDRCGEIVENMKVIVKEVRSAVVSLVDLYHKSSSKEDFFEKLGTCFSFDKDILKVAAQFEECGPSIGDELTKLRVVNILKGAITKVNEMDDDTLEEIRDVFGIMDMMSEDSWPDTKVEILNELDNIELMIGKCVCTLQGFDVLKQILDHRCNEATIIMQHLEDMKKGNKDWSEVSSLVCEKIGQHLVTDQEKAAYAFYLPKSFEKHGQVARQEPGDMLLF